MLILEELGLIPYEQALALQRERVTQRIAGGGADALLLCEHPEVITVGRALKDDPAAVAGARAAGLPIVEVSRGGKATLHLPGQIVGYPIACLTGKQRDLHALLRIIEESIIAALRRLIGLQARRREGLTGVWVEERKLASIGIAVDRWVSFHGFALNNTSDLARFRLIDPCGLGAAVMSSVEREAGPEAAKDLAAGFPKLIQELLSAGLAALGRGELGAWISAL